LKLLFYIKSCINIWNFYSSE